MWYYTFIIAMQVHVSVIKQCALYKYVDDNKTFL